MNIIDIIIIAVIGIFVVLGYIRGFVNSIISLAGIVLGVLFGRWFYEPAAAKLVASTNIQPSITNWVAQRITPTRINDAANINGPKPLADWFRNLIDISGGSVEQVSASIAELIINALCFVAIFIVVIIIINLIGMLLNKFSQLRGINLLNKIGGLVVGLIKGALLCAVVVSVIYLFTAFNDTSTLGELMSQSSLANWFYIGNWIF